VPDLELGPDDYRVRSKNGRWVPRDDWRLVLFAGIPMLGFWIVWAWWNRAELDLVLIVTLVGMCSFGIGCFAGGFFKRFD
jgi:hypothetical protein